VFERPPVKGVRYVSFTDPSGGSSDSMVYAVGHLDDDILVVDCVREIKAPFDPESATEEIAQLLALYKIDETTGDRYSGRWCAQAFEKRGVRYEHAEQSRSQLYLEMLPRINAKTIRVLDHPRAINQICILERRTTRGRGDVIDHPIGAHDDIANAIAGLCGLAGSRRSTYDSSLSWVGGPELGKEHEAIAAGVMPLPSFPRCLGDYSREDEKGCNAFPARQCSAPPIRQKRSAQSAIRWSGMRFSWHCFWAYCKLHKQTHALPNIPFEGRFVVKKIVIQKSQNRPYATPNPK
jgi:hypothetical protein